MVDDIREKIVFLPPLLFPLLLLLRSSMLTSFLEVDFGVDFSEKEPVCSVGKERLECCKLRFELLVAEEQDHWMPELLWLVEERGKAREGRGLILDVLASA